jgi:hypothetical protein
MIRSASRRSSERQDKDDGYRFAPPILRAGYENVNDAERLRHDPAMRWIVGGKAPQGRAASPSQMGR